MIEQMKRFTRHNPGSTSYGSRRCRFVSWRLSVLAVIVLAFLSAVPVVQAQSPRIPGLTHVIIISLDGARPDGILQANTPNIQALAAHGAVSWTAQTVLSATLPAHASMLTGLSVADHGVFWNSYLPVGLSADTPTVLLLAQQAGYKTAMVVGKEKLIQLRQSDEIAYTLAYSGDRSVVDRVVELLDEDYAVIFVHFPNPDYFGHLNGWMSETYRYEFSNTDRQVGRIITALDERGLTDETLVILTADHGGHATGHGTLRPEDMTIPWMIAGPGVPEGVILDGQISITDTAVIAAWALGLPVPEDALERPVFRAVGLFEQQN